MNPEEINHLTTVKQLKDAGWQVSVYHYRPKKNDPTGDLYQRVEFDNTNEINERGGYTKVILKTPDGKKTYSSECWCHRNDGFDKSKAKTICFGRIGKGIREGQTELDYVMAKTEKGLLTV